MFIFRQLNFWRMHFEHLLDYWRLGINKTSQMPLKCLRLEKIKVSSTKSVGAIKKSLDCLFYWLNVLIKYNKSLDLHMSKVLYNIPKKCSSCRTHYNPKSWQAFKIFRQIYRLHHIIILRLQLLLSFEEDQSYFRNDFMET